VTRHPLDAPAQPLTGAAPLRVVDDRLLIADLLGPVAARLVEHVPVAQLLDAGDGVLADLGLAETARRRLLAAGELARRFQPAADQPDVHQRPRDLLPHLAGLRAQPVEVLGILPLNARLSLLDGFCPVASGGLIHVAVRPREVFVPAVERRAAAIVIAHNHPSGDPSPSAEDRDFTRSMVSAGTVLGIRVLDHLIVARRAYFSFTEANLL
jgi:DNA repair protein RadC